MVCFGVRLVDRSATYSKLSCNFLGAPGFEGNHSSPVTDAMGGQVPIRLMNWILCCFVVSLTIGCGGGSAGSSSQNESNPQPAVSLSPATSNVRPGDAALQFTATVSGTSSAAVTWAVNGIAGGNSSIGVISTSGQYTAPATVPLSNVVTVQASLVSAPTVQGTSAVTLLNPIPTVSSVNPQTIGLGSFTIQVDGKGFMNGAQVMFGATALSTTFVSATQLNASGSASAAQAGNVVVTVLNPPPGTNGSTTSVTADVITGSAVTPQAAARFLDQSTFGPTPALITQVEQTGFAEFLTSQFATSGSTYPDPATGVTSLLPTQQVFFTNALNNPDQLRQRVALALSEIWVTSGFTVPPQGMAPYMRLLLQDAFVNYRTLMNDVTLSPAMGLYLNMVNNDNPPAGQHANENYSRELMQLFTLGLDELNEDGSLQLDSGSNPIPTYTQANVEAFALAYTGWTYPTQSGATLQKHNPAYWIGPMVPFESNHNMTAKTLLPVNGSAVTLPAAESAENDLTGALDNIFAQPNLPPFVCKQLIQHLVTSNPSAAYVKRVVQVFVSGAFSGSGVTVGSGSAATCKLSSRQSCLIRKPGGETLSLPPIPVMGTFASPFFLLPMSCVHLALPPTAQLRPTKLPR